jgi:hypothetical protein
MDQLEDLYFHMPRREVAHGRLLLMKLDTFIRNTRSLRKRDLEYNHGDESKVPKPDEYAKTVSYQFAPAREVLRYLPFFWFTDIKVVFAPEGKVGENKQVIYEVHQDCLKTKDYAERHRNGRFFKVSDFEQEYPVDKTKFPDMMYSTDAEDIQKIRERYGNPFQSFVLSDCSPLKRAVTKIRRKEHLVVSGIDAHLVWMSRDSADELLRLYWNLPERRFLRVEGYQRGLLERYDYGARAYIDGVFCVKKGEPNKRTFEDILQEKLSDS